MNTYTAFCQDEDGTGTIWVSGVKANSWMAAIDAAVKECAADWGCEPDRVHCLGIAEGEVQILHWEDNG